MVAVIKVIIPCHLFSSKNMMFTLQANFSFETKMALNVLYIKEVFSSFNPFLLTTAVAKM